MLGETKTAAERGNWLPFAGIVLASALAHLWCLGSQFYMDDRQQILDSGIVRSGEFWKVPVLAWTHFCYWLQFSIFGNSPVGFHAVNWLLHTAVACTLFGFGRDFIREKWPAGVALFGALLFAVHPLASEIPNYARTQDLAWVTLFSLLAAWAAMRFLRDGGGWKLAACTLFVAGAAISKGPGLFHALMVVGVVGLACLKSGQSAWLRKKAPLLAAGVAVLLAVAWLAGVLNPWLSATHRWSEPRFIGHAYTISRVFWEFAWRAVIPTGLSSDHLIAETLIPPGTRFWNIPDKIAILSMASFLVFAGFSGWLAWRKPTRLFGVCLFLFVATILFRLLYLIPEFMPEYRIYPGLPWFCLGAAILLAVVRRKLTRGTSATVPAILLLAALAFLSARRSFVWHDLDTLCGDVLRRYPARARALWELNDRDAAVGKWQAIIDRQQRQWPAVEKAFITENQRLTPAREIPSGDFVLAMVAIFGRYALAVAHTQGPVPAMQVLAQLQSHMLQMKMTPETKPLEWGHLHHARALVLEGAGRYQDAAAELRDREPNETAHNDLRRIEAKLAESKQPR